MSGSEPRPLTAVIVDDEPPARRKLRRFLERDGRIAVVGEAGTCESAVETIRATRPDVVFLDIQLGERNGFDVLEALDGECLPQVVFITAYDEFALKAFEVAAVDYLLKPFDAPRLNAAVERVRERLSTGTDAALQVQVRELLSIVSRSAPTTQRILVKTRDRGVLVAIADIAWIRAAGNYVELHVDRQDGKEHLLRETLEGMGRRLDPTTFLRVHRSFIVNANFIREIRAGAHGDHRILMQDGTTIRLSRRYRNGLPDGIRRHL